MFPPTDPLNWLLLIVTLWLAPLGLIIIYFAPTLRAIWREPVLRHPVLIVESDDWGAGPLEQTEALERVADILSSCRDHRGQPAVMTLAVILAVPDAAAIRASGKYRRRGLDDAQFAAVREAMENGVKQGVFAVQLHGLEHYWPPSLMASEDETVQLWLTQDTPQSTEQLPAHLQSRWIDTTTLPSRPLQERDIETAVGEEIELYQRIFGDIPKVVVPPTFIWSDVVEAAWAAAGVRYVVTPGRKITCRDAEGKPACYQGRVHNLETGRGVHYLVRDDYFEPMLGHAASETLAALERKTALARPCLLETHRANFLGKRERVDPALRELAALLQQALNRFPGLRFISTEALAGAMLSGNPDWLEHRRGPRLAVFAERITHIPRLGKLSRFIGLHLVLKWAATFFGHRAS
ncbi:hypothetical protein Tel_13510 [Candidatus Tenderia electrophaga]|jgi:hypothetical protein|uniref:Glycoside hydrolase family 57 N-terminal domain-containing protein n=1 Tax=Candidatus Tenderia electrophaga TaxID=1748243 RepID=A0A0S2TFX2_9GAMM|nr:hypothetical protein Tel_13510 [Candidatus Tenderia electrophaga]